MTLPMIRILFIGDNDDGAFCFQEMLRGVKLFRYQLDRCLSQEVTMESLPNAPCDIYIIDHSSGEHLVMDLMEVLKSSGQAKPVIILTDSPPTQTDTKLLKEGVADFLEKERLDTYMIERAIRYAIERTMVLSELNQSRQKIKELSLKLILAEEKQRHAIARDMHDSIGSNLTGIKYGLDNINRKGKFDSAELTQIITVVKDTINETRRIHTALRPPILDDLGMTMAARWLCRKFQEEHPDIQMNTSIKLQDAHIPDNLKIVIFRVLQEALNNIAKHSHAEQASVFLGERKSNIELLIEDNGQGFDWQPSCQDEMCEKGTGLDSMRERTELSGGMFQMESKVGHGVRIKSRWPDRLIKGIEP